MIYVSFSENQDFESRESRRFQVLSLLVLPLAVLMSKSFPQPGREHPIRFFLFTNQVAHHSVGTLIA